MDLGRTVGFSLLLLAITGLTYGQTFTVNDTGDVGDASPGDGSCATAGAVCTLRAAIEEANALAGAQTIQFAVALATYEAYVSEQNLLVDETGVPCRHPLLGEYFDAQEGRYVPHSRSAN